MLVDVSSLLTDESLAVNFIENFQIPPSYGLSSCCVSVHFDGKILNLDKSYSLEGTARYKLSTVCDCCLAPFDLDIAFDLLEKFDNNSTDEEVYCFEGKELDLSEPVLTNLLLSVPLKFLCKDDCKGLCGVCGQDLNKESGLCNCKSNSTNSRFDILKNMFEI